jgi:hypothetical protein
MFQTSNQNATYILTGNEMPLISIYLGRTCLFGELYKLSRIFLFVIELRMSIKQKRK